MWYIFSSPCSLERGRRCIGGAVQAAAIKLLGTGTHSHTNICMHTYTLTHTTLSLSLSLSKSQCTTLLDTFFPDIWEMLKNEVVSVFFVHIHVHVCSHITIHIYYMESLGLKVSLMCFFSFILCQDSGEVCSILKLCNSTSVNKMVLYVSHNDIAFHINAIFLSYVMIFSFTSNACYI